MSLFHFSKALMLLNDILTFQHYNNRLSYNKRITEIAIPAGKFQPGANKQPIIVCDCPYTTFV